MITDTRRSPHALVQTADAVCTGGFWQQRLALCTERTVPHIQRLFEDAGTSHVLENFRIAAGAASGEHRGATFSDGDFYKWLEALLYTACRSGDEAALRRVEGYIEWIAQAQYEDGYVGTRRVIQLRGGGPDFRFTDRNDFEFYNFGHLFTCACLHHRLTGRDSLLRVAENAAQYLCSAQAGARAEGRVLPSVCPSHYMGLVELYRETGNPAFLQLVRDLLADRDRVQDGSDDNQDRIPLAAQDRVTGHAVRANYLYAGLADLCAEEDNPGYRAVLTRVWQNLVEKKLYLTGGCGALYNGVSPYGDYPNSQIIHQAYGYEYQLPNITAYNEVCASIGLVMWAQRMFTLAPQAAYLDVLERALYNAIPAGVSLDGQRYFYEGMLRRTGPLDYTLTWPLVRSDYFDVFCCPPNVARCLSQAAEYAYFTGGDDQVLTGLYGAFDATFRLKNGAAFTLHQATDYPWDGRFRFTFSGVTAEVPFTLRLRIPGWAVSGRLFLNGVEVAALDGRAGSYFDLSLQHYRDAEILLMLDMPARLTAAHPLVEEAAGQVAVERGPLVYCAEAADLPSGIDLDRVFLPAHAAFATVPLEIEGTPLLALETRACQWPGAAESTNALYRSFTAQDVQGFDLRLIPYFAWSNRGDGSMRVWLPVSLV